MHEPIYTCDGKLQWPTVQEAFLYHFAHHQRTMDEPDVKASEHLQRLYTEILIKRLCEIRDSIAARAIPDEAAQNA